MFVRRDATILHADLDAFFAAVEQRDRPELRGRPVLVGAGVVLCRQLRGEGARRRTRRWASGERFACARTRSSSGRACPRTPRRARTSTASSTTRRRSSRGSRSTRPSSTSPACSARRAAPPRSPRGCGARSATRVGLPITVGIARTKFLAKVASGVAKPDGLLVVPPERELAVPAPAPGRAAVGRRAASRRGGSTTQGC